VESLRQDAQEANTNRDGEDANDLGTTHQTERTLLKNKQTYGVPLVAAELLPNSIAVSGREADVESRIEDVDDGKACKKGNQLRGSNMELKGFESLSIS